MLKIKFHLIIACLIIDICLTLAFEIKLLNYQLLTDLTIGRMFLDTNLTLNKKEYQLMFMEIQQMLI